MNALALSKVVSTRLNVFDDVFRDCGGFGVSDTLRSLNPSNSEGEPGRNVVVVVVHEDVVEEVDL